LLAVVAALAVGAVNEDDTGATRAVIASANATAIRTVTAFFVMDVTIHV
jgi:hypothetical protein